MTLELPRLPRQEGGMSEAALTASDVAAGLPNLSVMLKKWFELVAVQVDVACRCLAYA